MHLQHTTGYALSIVAFSVSSINEDLSKQANGKFNHCRIVVKTGGTLIVLYAHCGNLPLLYGSLLVTRPFSESLAREKLTRGERTRNSTG